MSHPELNCSQLHRCKAHLLQYSLTKSLSLETKFSLIKVLECTRGRQRKVICKGLKSGFYSKVLFLVVLRLKFLVKRENQASTDPR